MIYLYVESILNNLFEHGIYLNRNYHILAFNLREL